MGVIKRLIGVGLAVCLAVAAMCTIPATAVSAAEYNIFSTSTTLSDYAGAGLEGQGVLTPDADFAADQLLAMNCLHSGSAVFLTPGGEGGDDSGGGTDPAPDPAPTPEPKPEESLGFYCPN